MPILLHQNIHRPAAAPVDNLPFSVRSAGYYKIQPPFVSSDTRINFSQLFWCVRGSGIVEFDGRRRMLKRHQVALYYPNMRHYWYADRQYWEFYWLTMDGPFALLLPAVFGLEAGIYDAGPAPIKLFQTLLRLVGQPAKHAEMKACAIAFAILTRAAGSHADQTDELVNMAVKRVHQQYISPALNVKTLSASLGIRRAVLSARFRAATGMSPSDYLERLRVQHALSLLKHSRLAISAVAARCGYASAHYFSRAIRRITGLSPLQFRKHN